MDYTKEILFLWGTSEISTSGYRRGFWSQYYDAMGKHYLESAFGRYYSAEEFRTIMGLMDMMPNKKGMYPLRPFRNCCIEWV